ncbi:MAG: PfkB family carbohydrate kinase, partial [Mycobacteriales bacterium]
MTQGGIGGWAGVVVVGSLNVDLVTTVERHPAPGETVRGGELTRLPGGKGANQAIAAADVVLLQLQVPLATVRRAAEIAREHGVRVVLNPSPVRALPATLLDAADPLVVNAHEAASVGRTDACVTLGAAGARGGDDEITPPAVEVLDTTGAGDAFTGTLAAALAAGSGRVEALTAGVRAATTATTWPGAQDWTFETAGDLETTAGPDRGNPEARCQPPRLGFPPASRAPPPTRTARTTHMHRRVASLVCGRCTKFVVVVFWVAVVAVLGGLSTKLTDVQDNQAASWLPGSAEST